MATTKKAKEKKKLGDMLMKDVDIQGIITYLRGRISNEMNKIEDEISNKEEAHRDFQDVIDTLDGIVIPDK